MLVKRKKCFLILVGQCESQIKKKTRREGEGKNIVVV
jgi:hypothetical protein